MIDARQKTIVNVILCLVIILSSATLFAIYNNTDEEITIGKIIYIKDLGSFRPSGHLDEVTYVYSINGKDFVRKQRIGIRYPKQAVGNRVKVEYDPNDPQQSEAVGFYMDFKNSDNRIEFHASKKYGYHSIELINDLYYYTNYADSGYVIQKLVGKFTTNKDTLYVRPYSYDNKNRYRMVKYVLEENPNSSRRYGIRNVSNNRFFE